MAQVPNARDEFKNHIVDANNMISELMKDSGVMFDSALYGLLLAASYALSSALLHCKEYYVVGEISHQE